MDEQKAREYCCEKLHRAVQDDVVIPYGSWSAVDNGKFSIRGKPSMVNDGDGYFDDMTDEIEISYCPFCGKQLKGDNNA